MTIWLPLAMRLAENSIPEPNSGCFLWLRSTDSGGYGHITYKGKLWKAHRLAWIEANGLIPDGLCVLHRCDNRLCVNPEHLFLGTYLDNHTDMVRKGRNRQPKGENHNKAILTEAEVLAIRSSPLKNVELARLYNVSRSTIGNIRRNETWRYPQCQPE